MIKYANGTADKEPNLKLASLNGKTLKDPRAELPATTPTASMSGSGDEPYHDDARPRPLYLLPANRRLDLDLSKGEDVLLFITWDDWVGENDGGTQTTGRRFRPRNRLVQNAAQQAIEMLDIAGVKTSGLLLLLVPGVLPAAYVCHKSVRSRTWNDSKHVRNARNIGIEIKQWVLLSPCSRFAGLLSIICRVHILFPLLGPTGYFGRRGSAISAIHNFGQEPNSKNRQRQNRDT
jgi:hypothetical protein